jgi:acetyltransferase
MLAHPFAGTLYPVSRKEKEVMGRKAYASVAELPEPVDLAVLIIPAGDVPAELERCGRAGGKAAVVLSSGFAEARGDGGAQLQGELRAIAERYDMAVLGPNSEGFANTAAGLGAAAAADGTCPRAGRRRRPERRHRLFVLRPRPRPRDVLSLRRDDRQRGLPRNVRFRRVHPG